MLDHGLNRVGKPGSAQQHGQGCFEAMSSKVVSTVCLKECGAELIPHINPKDAKHSKSRTNITT
jgi:hypothetical protein